MARVDRVTGVAGLPYPARLEVSYPDPFTVYGFDSLAPLHYHYEPDAWLRELPLTEAQASFLVTFGRYLDVTWRPCWGQSAPTADVHVTMDEAARISAGEPWDAVLGLRVPLMVVARNEEEER